MGSQKWRYLYLASGDIMLDSSATENNHCSFPVSHYHGITITISVPEAVEGLGDLLSLFSIDLEQIEQQFTLKIRPFIMHGNSVPDHVISELYQVPENIRLEYLRVKVLELLVTLRTVDPTVLGVERPYFYKTQVEKVKAIMSFIENNIRFGNPSATKEEIIEAAKKARCHDFIMALPDGYETVIGEGGSTLSGGEKQRISIARAILKNANIVILDEATASIDPENEHLIQQAISELTIEKTVIVIAHRLATIEHADQILVVDKGQVVQKGTHQQLVLQEGLYRRFIMIREQAEGWSIA